MIEFNINIDLWTESNQEDNSEIFCTHCLGATTYIA